ncbi:MAG: HD domain-containing protein [Candidatus Sericytochromatia bacterium]|nr:HD domain-containing protein [Candidatus Sericytochromatia bacterium]
MLDAADWKRDCLHLVAKYGADAAHAAHVAGLADQLLEATWCLNWLQPADRPSLLAAAYLHDLGRVVDAEYHHRHSRYLVTHDVQTAGWPPSMRADVGLVVLNHRKRNPRGLEALRRGEMKRIRALAAVLRLADVFDHAHDQRASLATLRAKAASPVVEFTLSGVDLQALEPHLIRKATWAAQVWRKELVFSAGGRSIRVNSESRDLS